MKKKMSNFKKRGGYLSELIQRAVLQKMFGLSSAWGI